MVVVNGVKADARATAPGNKYNNPYFLWAQAYGAELALARDKRIYTFNARFTQDLSDFYQRSYAGTAYNARSYGFTLTAGVLFAR